jgi:predicted RND superfamily exporter protein
MAAMRTAQSAYFNWLVRHRWAALAVLLVVVSQAVIGASRVPIDFTLEQFFPRWGEERERYDRYKRSFPQEDMQVSAFWKDARPLSADVYRDLRRAADLFAEVGLEDVRWFGNVEVAEATEMDGETGLRVHRMIEEDSLSDAYVMGVLSRYAGDEMYRGYLWNAEQTVFAIHGALSESDMEDDRRRREVEEALQAELEILAGEGTEFVVSGVPVTRSRVPKLLNEDQRLFVGAGVLLFLAVLFLFFRHIGQALLCLFSIIPAYLCTVSLIGVAGKNVTVLTGFIPIIVLVVGGSDVVHLLTRYRQKRFGTKENERAVVDSFSELATQCFYTSVTTAIGFLSLMGTRIGIVMDFGFFTAVAIILTFVFSMTLLPLLLSFSRRERFNDSGLEAAWIRHLVAAAARTALRPSRRVLAGFAVVSIAALALALTLRVDTYLIDDLKKSAAVRRDLLWLETNGFGIYQVVLYVEASEDGVLHSPEMLHWMDRFQRQVADEPLVVNSFSLPNLLEPVRKVVADGQDAGGLPSSQEEAGQLILLAEMQDPEFFADVYHPLENEAQVVLTVRDAGSRVTLPFLDKVDRYLDESPPPHGRAFSTGTVKLIQNYSAQVLTNFGPSLVIAVVLIFGVMSYMFRSAKHGLIALIPNLFPLLVLLAVMRIAGFALKPSTVLVCSIAFGLAVDDTIHVLGQFRRALGEGVSRAAAIERSVRETGPAILMTTTVVCAGFSVLMASRFEVLFLVGMMTVVSALSAVAADLLVFPALVTSLGWGSSKRSAGLESTTGDNSDEWTRLETAVEPFGAVALDRCGRDWHPAGSGGGAER